MGMPSSVVSVAAPARRPVPSRAMRSSRIAVTALAALLAGSQVAEAKTFKLASLAPADSAWGRLITEMSAEVAKATGGKVKFKT